MTQAPRIAGALRCLAGVTRREARRFLNQRARLISALVRPLLWLAVFAVGFRAAVSIDIAPPYTGPVGYDLYVLPGLIAMVQLFNGMQSSLSMVYDREMGSMRLLLTSPFPRWWLLFCKLAAGTVISLIQVYVFLAIAAVLGIGFPPLGYLYLLPVLIATGLTLGALGLFLSSTIDQLENFAGVMNFVIFPMFFLSSALYPLATIEEGSRFLYFAALLNPFSHAVELIRFTVYGAVHAEAVVWVAVTLAVCFTAAVMGYDSKRGLIRRRR